MGKIRPDFSSYSQSSPNSSESEQSLYALKGYIETVFGKQQQSIKLNFVRFYDESIKRIQQHQTTELFKQNEIRRLGEIQEYKERWEKAQEIWLLLYLQQIKQNEVYKKSLSDYLELMAKQEMLAKALFLFGLLKHLNSDLIRKENQIKNLEIKREEIQNRLVNTITQLFVDSLPDEIKNSSQINLIRQRYTEQSSVAFTELNSSKLPQKDVQKVISDSAAKIVLKELNIDPTTSSSCQIKLAEKIAANRAVQQDADEVQNVTHSITQLKAEVEVERKQIDDILQQLTQLAPEIQSQARSILANTIPMPEQPKQEVLPAPNKNHNGSTLSIISELKLDESILDPSIFEDEPPLPPPSSPSAPPQSTITENNPKVELVNDKNTKESTEEPQPSSGLKPRQSGG